MNTRARNPFFRGLQDLRHALAGRKRREAPSARAAARPRARQAETVTFDIAPDDPLVAYFQSTPNAVEVDKLDLDSPALRALRAAGIRLTVPLVSQGELVGLLNLGPRLSEQDYSADDRVLLDNLALQAGPAVRVAQLVREQQAEIQARERLEQELRVARLIQQTLLPRELPALPGWHVSAIYRPARAVGGDFYDFMTLPDGRLALMIGDVTDKGVPAALVMATTRATIRSAAQQLAQPGQVLARVNEQLCPEIPPKMFVTCLYAVLDPATGRLQFANAGHDLPYRRSPNGEVHELRATGMPLGLMPGMDYEERETVLQPGETVLFYTDGLVEAHNPDRQMFSFKRAQTLMAGHADSASLIDFLLGELAAFTGPDWEQEDDVSLVTLERTPLDSLYDLGGVRPAEAVTTVAAKDIGSGDFSRSVTVIDDEGIASGGFSRPDVGRQHFAQPRPGPLDWKAQADEVRSWRTLLEFSLASAPGNEREAIQRVVEALAGLPAGRRLSGTRLERLKTAVGEATMNAMEHGNRYRQDLPAEIRVLVSEGGAAGVICVQVTDHGGNQAIPLPETPDIEAKLAGLQSPRGWGLFLIQNLVDEMHVVRDELHHTVELVMYLGEGDLHAGAKP